MKCSQLYISLLTCLVLSITSFAQKEDYNWITGTDGDTDSWEHGISLIDFNQSNPVFFQDAMEIDFHNSVSLMSDREGNFLFATNGTRVINSEGMLMENGDSLDSGVMQDLFPPYGGSVQTQGSLSLPIPDTDSLYLILQVQTTLDNDFPDVFRPDTLLSSIIKISQEHPLGKVIEKRNFILADMVEWGSMTGGLPFLNSIIIATTFFIYRQLG